MPKYLKYLVIFTSNGITVCWMVLAYERLVLMCAFCSEMNSFCTASSSLCNASVAPCCIIAFSCSLICVMSVSMVTRRAMLLFSSRIGVNVDCTQIVLPCLVTISHSNTLDSDVPRHSSLMVMMSGLEA